MTRQSSRPPGSPVPGSSRGGAQLATPVPTGVIGRYQILDKIGEGGMGSLFLARDPAIDRLVAIKLLRHGLDTEALRERFSREARAAGRLRHPHIVTIFDVGEHDGDPFIAMEFLAGETLAELIRDNARLSLSRRLKLLEELCDGLGYAHRAGLVHRDIKPANLMVDADGVLKILDFGIVRVTDSGMTQAGVLVGTVNYMSPEQVVGGAIDHRSDIFAVGLVAYELISGRQTFAGTMKDGLLNKILNVAAEPLATVVPGIDPDVVAIVEQSLQKDPASRYQDLVRMRNDLSRARIRLEQDEERAASAAAADAGETAVIGEHATMADEQPQSTAAAMMHEAEKALTVGNFRAALTLAGRSAAINPQDRTASTIAARAEAALLDRGRQLHSETQLSAPAAVVPSVPAVSGPSSASATQAGGGHVMWGAVTIALLALGVAVAALWLRNPDARPSPVATQTRDASAPTPGSVPAPPVSSTSAAPGQAAAKPEPSTAASPDVAVVAPDTSSAPPPATPSEPPAVTESKSADPVVSRGSSAARGRRESERRPPAPSGARVSVPLPAPAPTPTASKPVSPEAERPAAPAPLRVPVDTSAPRNARYVPPVYPADQQAGGVDATVGVELTIGPEGHVSDARILRSGPVRSFDDAALVAVRQWEFAPTRSNGVGVTVIYPVDVRFVHPPAAPASRPAAAAPSVAAPPVAVPPAPARPADSGRAAAPPPVADQTEEIRSVLRRYKAAWESLNPSALESLQALSAAEVADVRRTMATANAYSLDLAVQSVTVDPSGTTAMAKVTMTRRFTAKVGRAPNPPTMVNTVRLEKRGGAWLIVGIQ